MVQYRLKTYAIEFALTTSEAESRPNEFATNWKKLHKDTLEASEDFKKRMKQ